MTTERNGIVARPPIGTYYEFTSAEAARAFRYVHGTGGWIFEPDNGAACILFPPWMPPSMIFNHPLTKGRSGNLIGHG